MWPCERMYIKKNNRGFNLEPCGTPCLLTANKQQKTVTQYKNPRCLN